MFRKLKAVMLGALAISAIAGVSASSASAVDFHSDSINTTIHAVQEGENTFTTKAGNVKCKTATFAAFNATKTTTYLTVTPTYLNCTAFGQKAEVTTNNCFYTIDANGTIEMHGAACTGFTIHVPAGNCTVTVPKVAFGEDTVKLTNVGAGTTTGVTITSDVKKIKYVVDGPGTICGTPGTYEGVNGATYDGSVIATGEVNGNHTGIWVA